MAILIKNNEEKRAMELLKDAGIDFIKDQSLFLFVHEEAEYRIDDILDEESKLNDLQRKVAIEKLERALRNNDFLDMDLINELGQNAIKESVSEII